MLSYNPATGNFTIADTSTAGDPILFDTDDGFFVVNPADVFTGSISVPNRTASSEGVDGDQITVDVETDYYIATPSHPAAKVVRGMVRTAWASSPEIFDNAWRQASGTHIDCLDAVNFTSVPQSDNGGNLRMATIGGYTFFVNELGHLVMRERIVARARDAGGPPTRYNRVRQACTVSYRLLVGAFFGADATSRPGMQYRGFSGSQQNAASYNFTSTGAPSDYPAGYEFTDRRLVAVVFGERASGAGVAPVSATINGAGGTLHGTAAGTGSNPLAIGIASRAVPTGANYTLQASFGATQGLAYAAMLVLGNHTSATPAIASAESSGSTSVSITVTRSASDYVLLAVASSVGADTVTWTNATPLFDATNAGAVGSWALAYIPPGSGSITVTAAFSASGHNLILAAKWT